VNVHQKDETPGPQPVVGSRAFLPLQGLAIGGATIGLLGITGLATDTGGLTQGAQFAGAYLAVALLTASLVAPYVPGLAVRFGTESLYARCKLTVAFVWIAAGFSVVLGAPTLLVLAIAAPSIGGLTGVGNVLTPLMAKGYWASSDIGASYARLQSVAGIASLIGALLSGLFLDFGREAYALVACGVFLLPVALLVVWHPVRVAITGEDPEGTPWRSVAAGVRSSRKLRRALLLGFALVIFAVPLGLLTVPIAQNLRHVPLY
jgi:hypothetical protein